MKTTTANEYKENTALFFQLSDPAEIDKAAAKQMSDFTRTHFSRKGVFCLEENGEDWFRMTETEFAKI